MVDVLFLCVHFYSWPTAQQGHNPAGNNCFLLVIFFSRNHRQKKHEKSLTFYLLYDKMHDMRAPTETRIAITLSFIKSWKKYV